MKQPEIETIRGKRRLIREMCWSIEKELLEKAAKVPEEWNGFELRWLFAELVQRNYGSVRPVGGNNKTRFRDFENEVVVRNL